MAYIYISLRNMGQAKDTYITFIIRIFYKLYIVGKFLYNVCKWDFFFKLSIEIELYDVK